MSKSMFANPKSALGFAGVVIVIAIAASFGAGAFLPTSEEDAVEREVAVVEVDAAQGAPQSPSQAPAPAWGSGNLSDSWASSTPASNSPAENQKSNNVAEVPTQSFGDYQPAPSSAASQANRASSTGRSGPRITSRAAPSAPPLPSASQPAPSLVNQ